MPVAWIQGHAKNGGNMIRYVISVLGLFVFALGGWAQTPPSGGVTGAQSGQNGPSAQRIARTPDPADQEQVVSYWTTETGWRSELQLRNNLSSKSLTVTPTLRASDGSETILPPVTIKPQEVKSIDIEAALGTAAPQLVGTFGSLVLRYRSPGARSLYAALMVHNVGHPFAFHVDALAESPDYQAGGREGT